MAEKTGRNDPCPCGSKKKFKKCCEAKASQDTRTRMMLVGLGVLVVAGIVAAVLMRDPNGGGGAVWSPEHGHYHDASGREIAR